MHKKPHCCPELVCRACDKIAGSDFECTKCSPKGVGQEARSNAGIQRLKSLDYKIHPCISCCGPAFGCPNLLKADLLQNASMYSALRASHEWFKFNPIEFSPAKKMLE